MVIFHFRKEEIMSTSDTVHFPTRFSHQWMTSMGLKNDVGLPVIISLIPPGSEQNPQAWKGCTVELHNFLFLVDGRALFSGSHGDESVFGVINLGDRTGFCTLPIRD
jgi:hypothetical protein